DGIRDKLVTGVQTCALPICGVLRHSHRGRRGPRRARLPDRRAPLGYARAARAGVGAGATGDGDALAVHERPAPRVRPERGAVTAIRVAALADVAVGQPTFVEAGATRVVLVRIGDRVHALG